MVGFGSAYPQRQGASAQPPRPLRPHPALTGGKGDTLPGTPPLSLSADPTLALEVCEQVSAGVGGEGGMGLGHRVGTEDPGAQSLTPACPHPSPAGPEVWI